MDVSPSKKRFRSEDVILDDDELCALVDAAVAKKASIDETSALETAASSEANIENKKAVSLSHEDIAKLNNGEWVPFDLQLAQNVKLQVGEDINFYWFDAGTNQDTVYLFGKIFNSKTKQFDCASLKVQNINRRIFLLPRETCLETNRKVNIEDVFNEFAHTVTEKLNICKFLARKISKRYAFELSNIPPSAEYLEVLYSGTLPQLEQQFCSGNTYQHVFGANASILENFILDRNLKGPQWLTVKNVLSSPESLNDTWCQHQFSVNEPSQISTVFPDNLPSPKFTVLTLNMKQYGASEAIDNEIIAISGIVNKDYLFESNLPLSENSHHFCFLTCPSTNEFSFPNDFKAESPVGSKTEIIQTTNEKMLLEAFLDKFHQVDADIIAGHDLIFDYKYLFTRISHHGISRASWSRMGRLNMQEQQSENLTPHYHFIGRLLCDVKTNSKELIRAESYDLKELSSKILGKKRVDVSSSKLPQYYSTSSKLFRLIDIMTTDNEHTSSIMFKLNCLPLAKQITSIVGNLLSKTLLGGQSSRNEFLLLHAFNSNGYIVPDKALRAANLQDLANNNEQDEDENKSQFYQNNFSYSGGLVLEPTTGLYNNFILVMDFNSLYPSIIQEYDICFTTIDPKKCLISTDLKPSKSKGILPCEIKKLVDLRKEAKIQLANNSLSQDEKVQLEIKQKALKVIANSIYGCLGFAFSRFYAQHLAALVTGKGRDILLDSKSLVENLGYEVIYGDTDSLMVKTQCRTLDEVYEVGDKIQTEINRKYDLLEIGIDSVFRRMLLLKKKKYAGLSVSKDSDGKLQYSREVKGLEIIRHDWSLMVRNTASAVLDQILPVPEDEGEDPLSIEGMVKEIKDGLKMLVKALRANEFSLSDFVTKKVLSKDPDEYLRALPHSVAAARYNKSTFGKRLGSGDTIPYIICNDGTRSSVTQRAYHIENARQKINSGEIKVDIDYYITNQLLPVLTRLCEPITEDIALFLGIEPSRKRQRK